MIDSEPMFWQLVRPLAFLLPAEPAHHFSMRVYSTLAKFSPIGSLLQKSMLVADPRLVVNQFGLSFANPVGLAAGFDKDAQWFHELAKLGFSHVEIGTITGQPQPGNPRPRLFRLKRDSALINRMGFNNRGSQFAAANLARSESIARDAILGINIGKTKVVGLDQASEDYLLSFERLFPFADYFTVNVSSPNTPGLRELQGREHLVGLLQRLQQTNQRLSIEQQSGPKPVLLKIAPDLNDHQLQDIAEIARQVKLAGIIATNTTISRVGLNTSPQKIEQIGAGGLSGAPLTERSRTLVARLFELTEGQTTIVGVGGIMHGEDAWQMILSGASLVQLYTGFVYGGPSIVKNINRHLLAKLDQHKIDHISKAVGGRQKFG